MAIRLGMPWFGKADSAVGRYFCRLSQVYRGIQSIRAVNRSGGHSTRRPSLLRIGNQWSVTTSGRSVSDATIRARSGWSCQYPCGRARCQPPILGGCPLYCVPIHNLR